MPSHQSVWSERSDQILDVRSTTSDQPFCAGVLLVHEKSLLITLSWSKVASTPPTLCVGGVGGGQEPQEDIWTCAHREALEELGHSVDLIPSRTTYAHDMDTGKISKTVCVDLTPPFALQRRRNSNPSKPFRDSLPAGPFTYFGLFLARFSGKPPERFRPSDTDIAALLWMPLRHWSTLHQTPSLQEVREAGGNIAWTLPGLDEQTRLSLPPDESLTTIAPLLATCPQAWPVS